MRFALGLFGAVTLLLFTQAPVLADCSGDYERSTRPEDQIYGAISARCVPKGSNPAPAAASAPAPSLPQEEYDPWDFSGIQLEMAEPEMLVESGLDSGKAYKLSLPQGQQLNVFDKPNGNVIGGLEGGGDVRARYYYTADVNNVWAGVCGQNGACGWVFADYLFSLPPGRVSQGIYEVMAQELQVFADPNLNATPIGRIFETNRVMVVNIVESYGEHWAEVCRMESCGWTPAYYLSFVQ